jgi:hypothetical protein
VAWFDSEDKGGRLLYGYNWSRGWYRKDTKKSVRHFESTPVAKNVQLIFMFRRKGRSLHWIAAWLNNHGIAAPQRGKKWYARTVKVILDNEALYRGKGKYPSISID